MGTLVQEQLHYSAQAEGARRTRSHSSLTSVLETLQTKAGGNGVLLP